MKQIVLSLLAALSLFAANPLLAANPQVVMHTSKGDITLELYPEQAPKSVENFLRYVREGAYSGSIFHRVIKGFMIQGGGFGKDLQKLPVAHPPIENEADNGLRNQRGTIAMARTSDPNSATNQFFINTVDNDFLNFTSRTPQGWGYAVFGKVVEGMDVVDAIAKSKTGARGPFRSDVPEETVEIVSVEPLAAPSAGEKP